MMTENYFKILKGQYIKEYLKYYLTLNDIEVVAYDWGYKIKAITKLNDFNIFVNIDNDNCRVEELCDIALSKIKIEILKQYINPHL